MDKDTLEKIVQFHIRNVDKWYRMLGGLSSRLTAVVNNMLFITIQVSAAWRKDNRTTARQIAESWRDFNSELQHAKNYVIKIIPIYGICA